MDGLNSLYSAGTGIQTKPSLYWPFLSGIQSFINWTGCDDDLGSLLGIYHYLSRSGPCKTNICRKCDYCLIQILPVIVHLFVDIMYILDFATDLLISQKSLGWVYSGWDWWLKFSVKWGSHTGHKIWTEICEGNIVKFPEEIWCELTKWARSFYSLVFKHKINIKNCLFLHKM